MEGRRLFRLWISSSRRVARGCPQLRRFNDGVLTANDKLYLPPGSLPWAHDLRLPDMAASPSSSPRLPSPPPIAEDQLGPKSPLVPTEEQQKLSSTLDHGASRRIRPGTKAEDMAEGPPLVELSEVGGIRACHGSMHMGYTLLTPRPDRIRVPIDGTPEGTTQLSHASSRDKHYAARGPGHGAQAGAAARKRRQDAVVV